MEGEARSSLLHMLGVRWLLDMQIEILSGQLEMQI